MLTTAIIVALLVAPYLLSLMTGAFTGAAKIDTSWAGAVGVTLVFCFTATGHFIKTAPMAEMLPAWMPARVALVYVTGVLEYAAAMAVLMPRYRSVVGWGLIVMLTVFLPVNIYAAVNHVGMGGHQWGPAYLLIRVPLQLLLIGWVWRFAANRSPGRPA